MVPHHIRNILRVFLYSVANYSVDPHNCASEILDNFRYWNYPTNVFPMFHIVMKVSFIKDPQSVNLISSVHRWKYIFILKNHREIFVFPNMTGIYDFIEEKFISFQYSEHRCSKTFTLLKKLQASYLRIYFHLPSISYICFDIK